MASEIVLCADAARERGDPMPGTALNVRRFLLVEHPGPWGFNPFEESEIDRGVRARIAAETHAAGARALLIRRHGRVEDADARVWAVADVSAGRIRWGRWRTDADLLDACDALGGPSDHWGDEPVLLVCTHGRHDTCCAVRGRPVAAALLERHGEVVWECTHVGGDRFAATVVVLPDGTYYGGLDDANAGAVIDRHLAGTVTPEHLRGSSLLAPVAQAAAVAAHERFGPAGPRDVEAATVQTIAPGRWHVELQCAGGLPERLTAEVQAHQAAPAQLTCRAAGPSSARRFEVSELRVA